MIQSHQRALLIEDDSADFRIAKRSLGKWGPSIELVWAQDMARGLAMLDQEHFDVVLTDLSLPDSIGVEIVTHIRQHDQNVPVIVLTTLDDSETAIRALQLGAQDYLTKDDMTESLLTRSITYAIERRRMQRDIENSNDALRHAVHELEQSRATVEEANRLKSEFLANMSHEIRTPITAILGFAGILKDDMQGENAHDAVNTIQRNGEHLLQLINGILDLSKIEAGQLKSERIRFSPDQLLEDVYGLMSIRAASKNLALHLEYGTLLPQTIESDPTQLRQILINLIENAIKFTSTGCIRVVTSLLPDPNNPLLQFDVIDTGIGLDADQAKRIFSPFTQADSTTSRRFGGTGLGLTICRQLAQSLGGGVTLESRPGVGSTFQLTVGTGPLADVKQVAAARTNNSPTASTSNTATASPATKLNCHVLLAEDGSDNQFLISYILRKAGAEVTIVENGELACQSIQRAQDNNSPFAAVLMDMQMPVLDGYHTTRWLRERGCDTPIIAITANAMLGDRKKCLDAGCDDYLSKPINRVDLVDLVARYSSQRRSRTQQPAALR